VLIAEDPLAGACDLAIVLVLGDVALRCEELAALIAATSCPPARARSCAPWTYATPSAIVIGAWSSARPPRVRSCGWDRERTRGFGAPAGDAPLFITLGRRRRDGSYSRVGGRCRQPR
jgi:hypothetical protein